MLLARSADNGGGGVEVRRSLQLCSLFLVLTTLSGCFWPRKKTARLPPPPPSPAASHKTAPARHPTAHGGTASRAPRGPAEPRSAAAQAESNITAPASSDPAPTKASPPPAQLGEIYSPEQAAELTRNLNQGLATARKVLSQISGLGLTVQQREKAAMVKLLVSRAEAARGTDLSVAAQLARRAELLAQSLSNSMR